jgi:hypothetical protein
MEDGRQEYGCLPPGDFPVPDSEIIDPDVGSLVLSGRYGARAYTGKEALAISRHSVAYTKGP